MRFHRIAPRWVLHEPARSSVELRALVAVSAKAGRAADSERDRERNGTSYVLWWFFALSRNRARYARGDRG